MATITAPVAHPVEDRVFVLLSILCAAIAFTGFAGTYWLQIAAGTFVGSPLLHLHGLMFSGWTLLLVLQASWIAAGRRSAHRSWGLVGIALASAMVFTGVAVAVAGLQDRLAAGLGDGARSFLVVPLSAIFLFVLFVTAALVLRRRTDWHRRFMLVATVSLLNAAIARFFFLAATGGGPGMRPGLGPPLPTEATLMPGLLGDTIILLGVLIDLRVRGRVHPAWLWGLGVTLAVQLLRSPIGHSRAWLDFAEFLARFAG